jgi:hypothetical protein
MAKNGCRQQVVADGAEWSLTAPSAAIMVSRGSVLWLFTRRTDPEVAGTPVAAPAGLWQEALQVTMSLKFQSPSPGGYLVIV